MVKNMSNTDRLIRLGVAIVIGILVYSIVVAPMRHFSALSGGIALGIMMIPLVTRTTEELVRMVPVADSVARYAIDLVRATRPGEPGVPDFITKYVNYGASVRGAQFLILAAKARALSRGRYHVAYEDVRALAAPVLRHRLLLNFHAESDRLKSDDILRRLLEAVPSPAER